MLSDRLFTKIGFGSYSEWSGPYFRGSVPIKFATDRELTFLEKVLAVLTATETGGTMDAINMYDRCVATASPMQFGEACFGGRPISRIVSLVRQTHPAWVDCLLGEARLRMSSLAPIIVTLDSDTPSIQQTFLACSGKLGAWNDSTKAYAKRVAAVLATLFGDPRSHEAQYSYTMPKLLDFAFGDAKKLLFPANFPDQGWDGALRAIFLSFAANLPAVAARRVDRNTLVGKTPKDACIALAKRLTFEPGIAIYPGRFDKIALVVEKLFGVDLPDFSSELKKWTAAIPELETFPTIKSWQIAFVNLGYDLGPSGADGKDGPKTRAAVTKFQRDNGLEVDGMVGRKTLAKLVEVVGKRKQLLDPPE
jgi:hypothetical protein